MSDVFGLLAACCWLHYPCPCPLPRSPRGIRLYRCVVCCTLLCALPLGSAHPSPPPLPSLARGPCARCGCCVTSYSSLITHLSALGLHLRLAGWRCVTLSCRRAQRHETHAASHGSHGGHPPQIQLHQNKIYKAGASQKQKMRSPARPHALRGLRAGAPAPLPLPLPRASHCDTDWRRPLAPPGASLRPPDPLPGGVPLRHGHGHGPAPEGTHT